MSLVELLRQYKIGPFSIFDFVLALGGVYLLAPLMIRAFRRARISITRAELLWLVVPLSVVSHLLVGSMTPLTRMVVNPTGDVVAKIILLGMLYMGLRGVVYRLRFHN